ncbi:tektin-like protein 1 isoform X2 [Lineus longissimus]|uniref:tektin-like protein 1 isoform X2 n=1 Tax=Lineus longissimus TaxID=88925 RepID=UPI00315D7E37
MQATKTMPMGTATIGPQNWRNSTIKDIKLSQNVVQRSDKNCDIGRSLDPLPHLRETVAELSNDEAHRHFRETRAVVAKLRESLLDTNEEIKSLTRGKEALEKALEHKRKDLRLNKDSLDIRLSRPARERDQDGADDLLNAERQHLLNLKKILEAQLKLVQQQLQVLDSARKRLATCLRERSRVLDLICHNMASVPQSAPNTYRSPRPGSRLGGSFSARFEKPISKDNLPPADPLGSFTPEAEQALQEANGARARSAMLRRELNEAIMKTDHLQKAAHASVNDGLLQKLSETVTLRQHLNVGSGENRHAVHRAQRWYDATEKARGNAMGPVCSSDLTTREKLDRPIFRVFQRHPGTQMPEAQEIVKAGDGLTESLIATNRNIGLLKLSQARLAENIRDKKEGYSVDSSVLRLRRRRANHRWAMGEAF